jgi:predicted nucleotidyltransferase
MTEKICTIEDLKDFLRTFFEGRKVKVYLFGSRARKEHKAGT